MAANSKELTALPQLVELLDRHEKMVTSEALGCQKDMAETSVAGGGDSL